MNLRSIEEPDFESVRRIARASLAASYDMVDESVIDAVVDDLYARDTLAAERERAESVTVVGERDGTVVGFAQAEIVADDEGTIRWLHVHPDHRGEGVGSAIYRRIVDELTDRGMERVSARVLAAHEEGTRFYEDRDFERRTQRTVEIGDETLREAVYVDRDAAERDARPVTTAEGDQAYVDLSDADRGSSGPFYPVYTDDDRTDRWGWYCGVCESSDTAMDTMGRIECASCGNQRAPSRWDAAYL